jgi:hypothetical protein
MRWGGWQIDCCGVSSIVSEQEGSELRKVGVGALATSHGVCCRGFPPAKGGMVDVEGATDFTSHCVYLAYLG